MGRTTEIGKLRTFEEVLADQLKDPEFRAEWERLAPARAVALRILQYRTDHGLTQTALGRKVGMSQPAIARLEAAEHTPSLETLMRLAERLGMSFRFEIRPAGGEQPDPPTTNPAQFVQRVTTEAGAELLIATS